MKQNGDHRRATEEKKWITSEPLNYLTSRNAGRLEKTRPGQSELTERNVEIPFGVRSVKHGRCDCSRQQDALRHRRATWETSNQPWETGHRADTLPLNANTATAYKVPTARGKKWKMIGTAES